MRILTDNICGLTTAIYSKNKNINLCIGENSLFNGFKKINKNDNLLHLGSRLIELDYKNAYSQDSIGNYVLGYKSHNKYMGYLNDFFNNYYDLNLKKAPDPLLEVNHTLFDDFIFNNDIKEISNIFDFADLKNIEHELKASSIINSYDDYQRLTKEYNYLELSRKVHTSVINEAIFEPLLNKICEKKFQNFLSKYHRLLWLPLFWDSSIKKALNNKESFNKRTFYQIVNGDIVDVLIRSVEKQKNVNLSYFDELPEFDKNDIISLDSKRLYPEPYPDFSELYVSWVEVKKEFLKKPIPQITFTSSNLPYRISMEQNIICIEHGLSKVNVNNLIKFLVNNKFAQEGLLFDEILSSNMKFYNLPTYSNIKYSKLIKSKIDSEYKNFNIVGPILEFGTNSLNEQIINGIHLGLSND